MATRITNEKIKLSDGPEARQRRLPGKIADSRLRRWILDNFSDVGYRILVRKNAKTSAFHCKPAHETAFFAEKRTLVSRRCAPFVHVYVQRIRLAGHWSVLGKTQGANFGDATSASAAGTLRAALTPTVLKFQLE